MTAKLLSARRIAGGDGIAVSLRGGNQILMSKLKLIVPAALVLGGFLVCSTASYGKPEYTKATKKACSFCHTVATPKSGDPKAKELTPAGKYYEEHKSLDGYTEKK
jgi:hypothetical protein